MKKARVHTNWFVNKVGLKIAKNKGHNSKALQLVRHRSLGVDRRLNCFEHQFFKSLADQNNSDTQRVAYGKHARVVKKASPLSDPRIELGPIENILDAFHDSNLNRCEKYALTNQVRKSAYLR